MEPWAASLRKGGHSVGVAPQSATSLGRNDNCQTLVFLPPASAEVPGMIGLRLFLPQSWTNDASVSCFDLSESKPGLCPDPPGASRPWTGAIEGRPRGANPRGVPEPPA